MVRALVRLLVNLCLISYTVLMGGFYAGGVDWSLAIDGAMWREALLSLAIAFGLGLVPVYTLAWLIKRRKPGALFQLVSLAVLAGTALLVFSIARQMGAATQSLEYLVSPAAQLVMIALMFGLRRQGDAPALAAADRSI